MRYLGLDVGSKRIGVAMTDPLGWTVQPVETLQRDRIERDLEAIANYVQDFAVRTVVVGLPLRTERGEVGRQAQQMLRFCEQLRAYLRGRGATVEVVTWDESMSTHDAEAILDQLGATTKQRKKRIDQLAAVMILQSYLASLEEPR